MSFGETVLLGAIAGFTIFLGLPFGRLASWGRGLRIFMGGVSGGILVFLLFDILGHATEPVESALVDHNWGDLAVLGAAYVGGFALGLLGLLHMPRWGAPRPAGIGPGAMAVAEADPARAGAETLGLGMTIAVGIGLHNFSEGLAIGQSAASGAVSLALLLVIGFGLHNATEGFGIIGPLVARGVRPSWAWLGLAGLVAGGPDVRGDGGRLARQLAGRVRGLPRHGGGRDPLRRRRADDRWTTRVVDAHRVGHLRWLPRRRGHRLHPRRRGRLRRGLGRRITIGPEHSTDQPPRSRPMTSEHPSIPSAPTTEVTPITSLEDPRVIQILSTEHWSLLSARGLAFNEAFIRGGMFLTFLSTSFVALALLAQAMTFGVSSSPSPRSSSPSTS